LKLAEHIKLVSPTDMSVLIIGESGTEIKYSQGIHENSRRTDRPFIAVDCGAIQKS
jgi:two-component system response regulator HydG